MGQLIEEFLEKCMHNPTPSVVLTWVAFVTVVVWSPYLFPQWLSSQIFGCGMVYIIGAIGASVLERFVPPRFVSPTTPPLPSVPLLELTALGLTAAVVWIDSVRRKREKDENKLAWQKEQYRDWANAARLALWATLSLMPMVKWM